MPNKISEWINPPHRTTMDAVEYRDQCRKHAALADRLVEAAEALATEAKLTDDYQEWYGGSLHCAVHQLTAILGEIESEEKYEHTN